MYTLVERSLFLSGHVLRVKAPWMHHVLACAEDVYVIPKYLLLIAN